MSNLLKRQNSTTSSQEIRPEKCQKLILKNLDDLSDEVQLKIFNYLTIKDLICCGQVSKKTRRISCDASVWQKINLSEKVIPSEFLKHFLNNGCQYLNLSGAKVKGDFSMHV